MTQRIHIIQHPKHYAESVRISLLDRDYSGATRQVEAESPFFELVYNEQPSLTESFIPSALTAYFMLFGDDIAADPTLIDDLTNGDDERFVLTMHIGVTEVWRGGVQVGAVQYADGVHGDYPITIPVTAACGINRFDKRFFNREPLAERISEKLNDVLTTYSYNVDWQPTGGSPTNTFNGIEFDARFFTDGDLSDPQPVTQKFFLEQILKRFASRLYRWGGWKIESLDAASDAWQAPLSVQDRDWSKGLIVSKLPSLQRAELSYDHKSLDAFQRPPVSQTYDQNGYTSNAIAYDAEGSDLIRILGTTTALTSSIPEYSISKRYKAGVRLFGTDSGGTTYYWNQDLGRWQDSLYTNYSDIDPRTGSEETVSGSYNIEAYRPPVTAFTVLQYQLLAIEEDVFVAEGDPSVIGARATQNRFSVNVTVIGNEEASSQLRTTYGLVDNNANTVYDHGELLLGDRIASYTPAAMIIFGSNQRTETWINNVYSSPENIDALTLRTILGYQNGVRTMLRGTLNKPYEPTQMLSYGGKLYKFVGGSFEGAMGAWTGTWIEWRYVEPSPTFQNYLQGLLNFAPIDFGTTDPTLLEVESITGTVNNQAYKAAGKGGSVTWQSDWANVQLRLKDGTLLSPEDGGASGFVVNVDNAQPELLGQMIIFPRDYSRFNNKLTIVRDESIAEVDWIQVGDEINLSYGGNFVAYEVTNVQRQIGTQYIVTIDGSVQTQALKQYSPISVYRQGSAAPWEGRLFYYDAEANTINDIVPSDWAANSDFADKTRYTFLWRINSVGENFTLSEEFSDLFENATGNEDSEADIREIIAGFRANAVTKLGADVDGSVTELQTDASMPVRVDLPLGTRLLLVSGDEAFEVVTSAKVDAGADTIPILEADLMAFKGAKILFDNAFLQSQLLVQPSEVYIYAQSVNGTATSALNLSTTNQSAIASLTTTLNGVNGTATSALNLASTNEGAISSLESTLATNGITGSTNITGRVSTVEGEVDSLQANIVLTTDVNGNIAELDLSSNNIGSLVKVTGDQIVLSNNITKIGDANFEQQGAGWQYTSDTNFETGFNPVQNYVVWTPQQTVKKQGAFALQKISNSPASVSYILNRSRIPIRFTDYGAPNGANLIRRGTELTISAWIKTGASSQGKIGLALYDAPTLDANDNEIAVNLNRWIGGTDIFANTDWTLVKLRVKFNGLTNNPSGVEAIQAWRDDDALPFFNSSTNAQNVVYAKVLVQGVGTQFYVDDIQCTDLVDEVVIADGAITAPKITVNELSAISANLGDVNVTGNLLMSGGKFATNLTGARIEMQDDNFRLINASDEVVFLLDRTTEGIEINADTKYSTANGIEIDVTDTTLAAESQSITWFRVGVGATVASIFDNTLTGTQTITQLNSLINGTINDGDGIIIKTSVGEYSTIARSNHAYSGTPPTPNEIVQFDSVSVNFGASPVYSIHIDTGSTTRSEVSSIASNDSGRLTYNAPQHRFNGLLFAPDIPTWFVVGSNMIYVDANGFLKLA